MWALRTTSLGSFLDQRGSAGPGSGYGLSVDFRFSAIFHVQNFRRSCQASGRVTAGLRVHLGMRWKGAGSKGREPGLSRLWVGLFPAAQAAVSTQVAGRQTRQPRKEGQSLEG